MEMEMSSPLEQEINSLVFLGPLLCPFRRASGPLFSFAPEAAPKARPKGDQNCSNESVCVWRNETLQETSPSVALRGLGGAFCSAFTAFWSLSELVSLSLAAERRWWRSPWMLGLCFGAQLLAYS